MFRLFFLFVLQLIVFSEIYSQKPTFDGLSSSGNTLYRLRMTVMSNSTGNCSLETWSLTQAGGKIVMRSVGATQKFTIASYSQNPRLQNYLKCNFENSQTYYLAQMTPNITNPNQVQFYFTQSSGVTFKENDNADQELTKINEQIRLINERFNETTLDNKTQNLNNMKESSALASEIIRQAKAKLEELKALADKKRNNDDSVTQDLIKVKNELDKLIRQAKGLTSNCEYEELKKNLLIAEEVVKSQPFLLLSGADKGKWQTSLNNAKQEITTTNFNQVEAQIKEISNQIPVVLKNIKLT